MGISVAGRQIKSRNKYSGNGKKIDGFTLPRDPQGGTLAPWKRAIMHKTGRRKKSPNYGR